MHGRAPENELPIGSFLGWLVVAVSIGRADGVEAKNIRYVTVSNLSGGAVLPGRAPTLMPASVRGRFRARRCKHLRDDQRTCIDTFRDAQAVRSALAATSLGRITPGSRRLWHWCFIPGIQTDRNPSGEDPCDSIAAMIAAEVAGATARSDPPCGGSCRFLRISSWRLYHSDAGMK
jgi:hypothetical protein